MSASTTTPEEALRLWREKLASPKPIPVFEFDPPPPIIERIISDLNNKQLSFAQVAERANTTTEALSIWLVRPDIALRMDAMESMCNRRARLQIVNHVDAMIDTCATVMERYCRAPDRGLSLAPDPKSHAICTRNTSNALMATRIMMHMKRFFDDAPRARRSAPASHEPDPAPAPPTTTNTQAPNPTTRIETFPRLQDPVLNLHDERAANQTTPNNPTRDNSTESLLREREVPAFTSPSRKRSSDASSFAHEMGSRWLPDAPASGTPSADPEAHEMGDRTPQSSTSSNSAGTASQPEGLIFNSRGLSESSSATPGKLTIDVSHPVRVQLPIAPEQQPCSCHTKPHKRKPCKGCEPTSAALLTITGTATPRARDPTNT